MKSQREGSKTLLGLFGASCRAAAQSARRAGVDSVWAWDDFLDADLISIAEAIPLSEFRLEENKDQEPSLDGLPIVLCGGMENQPDLVQALIERGVQCGTNGLMLRELRSVVHWEKWALESGVGWPESFFVSEYLKGDRKNGVRAAAIASGNRWMCKSTVGAGGMRVQRFDSLEAFVRDFKSHRDSLTEEIERTSFDQTTYAQRMVDGITIGVSYCASSDGVRIAGIARGIVKGEFVAPREFIYRGNTAPYPVPEELREALQRFGNVVTAATSVRGLWQADFQVDTNGNAWLLEINPRWSASMELHEAIAGYSWMREHLRAITGDRTPVKTSEPVYSTGKLFGKAIVYAPRNLETTETSLQKLWDLRWLGTVSELEEQSTDGPFRFRVADIPKDTHFPEGVPVLTVYSTGANHSELIGELTRGREEVLKILESR